MTHQIVEVLEVVEVYIKHGKGFAAALSILECHSQPVVKGPAIGKAGERVGARQLADHLIGFNKFAGVPVRPPHKGKNYAGQA